MNGCICVCIVFLVWLDSCQYGTNEGSDSWLESWKKTPPRKEKDVQKRSGGLLMTNSIKTRILPWTQPFSENPSSLLLELGCIPAFTCVAAPLHQVETRELGVRGESELGLYREYVYGVRICVETTRLSGITPANGRCSVNVGAGYSGRVWEWAGRGPGSRDWEGHECESTEGPALSHPCSTLRPRTGRTKDVLGRTQHSQGRFLYPHSVSRH